MADATELCVSADIHDAPLALPGRGIRPSELGKKVRRASSTPMIASFREAVASAAGEPEAMDSGACLGAGHLPYRQHPAAPAWTCRERICIALFPAPSCHSPCPVCIPIGQHHAPCHARALLASTGSLGSPVRRRPVPPIFLSDAAPSHLALRGHARKGNANQGEQT